MRSALVMCVLAGCALNAELPDDTRATGTEILDGACGPPPRNDGGAFRRTRNRMVASFGGPRHRGVDVIAVETDEKQTVAGKLAYTAADKDVSGEDVELYACIDRDWANLGKATTGSDGRFAIELAGEHRLPVGMRELAAFVPGDATTFRFLAFVARAGESVVVTDVDGTITESENAIVNTVLFGDDIGHRRGAPEALARLGKPIVYVTARGDQLTDVTRRWLRAHGFPPGPLRLARETIVKPGAPALAFKTEALRTLGVPIAAAIGNKLTDIVAYRRAGIPANRIFVKLPEFEAEVAPELAARHAIGFRDYQRLNLSAVFQ
ncbi:MAG TPA: hypothetical protein VFQ53_24735 [Kofleriaceae bacterium]|nr:hypothetical protein [Kofleriaceae bacterium]